MNTDWKDILAGLNPGNPESDIERDNKADYSDNPASYSIQESSKSAGHPALTIFYEKKGRSGKPATILTGFNADDAASLREADELAAALKKRLGCGGSARGGEILLQGDRRQQLKGLLASLGYKHIKGI